MSDQSVKWWWLFKFTTGFHGVREVTARQAGDFEVIEVSEYERIVAETVSKWQADAIKWGQAIATQKRVIERLKEQRNPLIEESVRNETGGLTEGKVWTIIDAAIARCDAEIAAIERGET